MRYVTACFLLALGSLLTVAYAQTPDNLELWLASGPECNTCQIFEDVARKHAYGTELVYRHAGVDLRLPIHRISKAELPAAVLAQLTGESGPGGRWWPLQLTVIVLQEGRVLHSGNIAESMDLRTAPWPEDRMHPPAHPPSDHPSLQAELDYRQIFVEHWNLEYFAAVAVGDQPARRSDGIIDSEASDAAKLGRSNVVLWGAAQSPIKNALFISQRMREIDSVLRRQHPSGTTFITLYGAGPGSDTNDTSMMDGKAVAFGRVSKPVDYAADLHGIDALFSGLRRSQGAHTLLVHVGHSGPPGIPIWGLVATVTPGDFAKLGGADRGLVMVSGGCNGGLFARSVECGFFAAHPQVVSTGCQLSPAAIERSADYPRLFFQYVRQHGRGARLVDAHWHASVRLEDHQISYTTVDALADEYFARLPERLPRALSVAELRNLRSAATPAESAALTTLLSGLSDQTSISLTDLVERNHAAQTKLKDARESSSTARNRIIALPYRLMLPMLARRLIFRSANTDDAPLKRATQCEQRTLSDFLE